MLVAAVRPARLWLYSVAAVHPEYTDYVSPLPLVMLADAMHS